jgi:hypothetical protein
MFYNNYRSDLLSFALRGICDTATYPPERKKTPGTIAEGPDSRHSEIKRARKSKSSEEPEKVEVESRDALVEVAEVEQGNRKEFVKVAKVGKVGKVEDRGCIEVQW